MLRMVWFITTAQTTRMGLKVTYRIIVVGTRRPLCQEGRAEHLPLPERPRGGGALRRLLVGTYIWSGVCEISREGGKREEEGVYYS